MISKIENSASRKQMCLDYGIGETTVRDVLKQKDKLLAFASVSDSASGMKKRKTMKKSTYNELDSVLAEWIRRLLVCCDEDQVVLSVNETFNSDGVAPCIHEEVDVKTVFNLVTIKLIQSSVPYIKLLPLFLFIIYTRSSVNALKFTSLTLNPLVPTSLRAMHEISAKLASVAHSDPLFSSS
uniref:HTH psq-type domain-containing protein n=1 Tax=Timema genevievae TaxID=629358 RepID=A0A7R9JTN5_TIMGE|nr:unnamed protein product [Timema genevievae]